MRGMIVAAGLGTRLRPLSELRPKPALPVRGIPLIAYQLALLARHGVREVVINAHHLPELLMEAARRHCPPGMGLHFSVEPELLDTGGAIRRVSDFLRASDPCLILGGDMLLDADLSGLLKRHRQRGDAVTMLLRRDPRADRFGTVGVDAEGRVRRIGRRFDLGGETRSGVYVWANVVAARALDDLPDRQVFSHFDDWLAPSLAAGARDVRGEVMDVTDCTWEPVGTPAEYLAANLRPPPLSYLDADAEARRGGTRLEPGLVIGAGATLGAGARLERAVVWDGERVPPGLRASDGVFAGGAFHPCGATGEGS
jgi:NDP-sugar pyrophosphorylase family protein